jgi:hypothetical protein
MTPQEARNASALVSRVRSISIRTWINVGMVVALICGVVGWITFAPTAPPTPVSLFTLVKTNCGGILVDDAASAKALNDPTHSVIGAYSDHGWWGYKAEFGPRAADGSRPLIQCGLIEYKP